MSKGLRDLTKLLGTTQSITLDLGYLNYGQNFYPPYGAEVADQFFPMNQNLYPSVTHTFAPRATITFLVRDEFISGIEQSLLYRGQVDYTW